MKRSAEQKPSEISSLAPPSPTKTGDQLSFVSERLSLAELLGRVDQIPAKERNRIRQVFEAAQEAKVQRVFIVTPQGNLFTTEGARSARFLAVAEKLSRAESRKLQLLVRSEAPVFYATPEQVRSHWNDELSEIAREGGFIGEVEL
jgi:thiamine pyrophosphate-dependent acetolactate synthase large subunit-like protein